MRCIRCGQEIPDNSVFCTYCGANQSATQQMQPQQTVQPQQPQYQQPMPQQPQYQQPAPQGGGNGKGPLIACICICATLIIIGILVAVVLIKKDDNNKRAERTTEATTEATTEEITTEEVAEATPDEPAPTPYAEEYGITFSGLGDKASGNAGSAFTMKSASDDPDGNDDVSSDEFADIEGVSTESCTFESYINDVLVSEPDSEGNVIYTVEVKGSEDTSVMDSNREVEWVVTSLTWRPRVFDYYSGSYIDDGGRKSGVVKEDDLGSTTLTFDDKETNVTTKYINEWINKDSETEETDNGKRWHFVSETKYVYSFKVPQDYDGLVMVLYNADVDQEEYDKSYDLGDKPRYKDDSGNPIKFFDEDAMGYTKDADKNMFIRLSDVAREATPDAIASVYSVIEYPEMPHFEWTDAVKDGDYSQGNETITDSASVNGWWQGYLLWDPDNTMDSYGEELCNVELTSNGDSLDWKWDYYAVKWGEDGEWETKDDDDLTITGTFNSDGTLTFDSDSIGMDFEMYGFYTDGYCQYAVGWLTSASGETAWVFLYRP